jgi:hypothetical protein
VLRRSTDIIGPAAKAYVDAILQVPHRPRRWELKVELMKVQFDVCG